MSNIFFLKADKADKEGYSLFRKKFYIDKLPKKAVARMLPDGHCALFINGSFVEGCQGRHPGRVAAFDVLRFLKEGENVIALKLGGAYMQGTEKRSYELTHTHNTMLAFSLDMGREKILSDDDVLCGITDDEDWNSVDFDESDWTNAEAVLRVSDADYENCWLAAPVWKPFEPVILRPEKVLPLGIYDFGKTVVGYLEFHFTKGFGKNMTLYFDGRETAEELESEKKAYQIYTIRTTIPENGIVRIYRRRAFRFVRVVEEELVPKEVMLRECSMPLEVTGNFECSDPLLNEIDKTAEYTLHINMHREFESCPRGEMLGFTGDVRICSLTAAYLYGETELAKAFFTIKHGNSTVLTPGRVYSRTEERGLWDYPAWYLIMVRDYVLWTGDTETACKLWDSVVMNAGWYEDKLNKDGLLYQPLLYTDNGFHITEYTCSSSRTGYKAFLNAAMCEGFNAAAELAEWLGKENEKKHYETLTKKTRRAISENLWNKDAGAFYDKGRDYIPQDGNALAVLYDAADSEQKKSALEYLKNNIWSKYGSAMADKVSDYPDTEFSNFKGSENISPLMNTYEAEARFKFGSDSDALELIRRTWGSMLDKGAKTFWEYNWNDPKKRWLLTSHGWSAGTAYLMRAYVGGIRPVKPGFEEVIFNPHPGELEWFNCTVPSPLGVFEVTYSDKRFTLKCPKGVKNVQIKLPKGTILE